MGYTTGTRVNNDPTKRYFEKQYGTLAREKLQ